MNSLTITPAGKFEFSVGKFKWPFKDSRSPEVVAKLFDASLHITADMLRAPTVWTPSPALYIDWEKSGKYYNIIRIHAQ